MSLDFLRVRQSSIYFRTYKPLYQFFWLKSFLPLTTFWSDSKGGYIGSLSFDKTGRYISFMASHSTFLCLSYLIIFQYCISLITLHVVAYHGVILYHIYTCIQSTLHLITNKAWLQKGIKFLYFVRYHFVLLNKEAVVETPFCMSTLKLYNIHKIEKWKSPK